jgi:hypothetical protein
MNFGMRGEENFRSALDHLRCNAVTESHATPRRFADNEMSCCALGAEEITVAEFLQQTASSANLAQHQQSSDEASGVRYFGAADSLDKRRTCSGKRAPSAGQVETI